MKPQEEPRRDMPEYVPGLPVGEIVRALNSVRFGEVRIVRQNANIVQIDKIEKTRFTQ